MAVYAAGASGDSPPITTIAESTSGGTDTSLIDPVGIAVSPSGDKLYVETGFSFFEQGVSTFVRDAGGNYASTGLPTQYNQGGSFLGLAVDASGNTYQESNVLAPPVPNAVYQPGILTRNGIIGGSETALTPPKPPTGPDPGLYNLAVSPDGREVCSVVSAALPLFPVLGNW